MAYQPLNSLQSLFKQKMAPKNTLGVNAKAPTSSVAPKPVLPFGQQVSKQTLTPKSSINTSSMSQPKAQNMSTPTQSAPFKNNFAQAPKAGANSSVLAQQKALNAKGAGLVEDGIMGPKTQAAIAKYKTPTTQNTQNTQQNTQQNTYNASDGSLTDYGRSTGAKDVNNNSGTDNRLSELQNYQPTAPKATGPDTSNAGLLTSLATQGSKAGPEYQKISDDLATIRANIAKSKENYAKSRTDLYAEPGGIVLKEGRDRLLQQQYGMEQTAMSEQANALADQLSAANAQQQMQQSATSSALGYTQPQFQFGMLTNPQTGQIVGGGGSTASGVMQSALQNAYNMYRQGASVADIMSTSGLDTFGVLGKNALINAINQGGIAGGGSQPQGGFNPTSYNTQVQGNQQNLLNTQGEAFQLNQNLQQVAQIEPMILGFLQNSGINPFDAQIYNSPVYEYLNKVGNSGAATQWAAQMGDLKNFTSQILAQGYGGTPTGAEAATLSQDPSRLSYSGLQAYLHTLKQLGNNRLSVLQQNQKALGGGSVGYTGQQAPISNSTQVAPAGVTGFGTGITNPTAQAAAGATMSILPTLARSAVGGAGVGIGSKLLNFFTRKLGVK